MRKRGIRLIIYLDDILILKESKSGTEEYLACTVSILEQCGFLINREKSARPPGKLNILACLRIQIFYLYLSQRRKSLGPHGNIPDRNRRPRIVTDTCHWNNWVCVILEMFRAKLKNFESSSFSLFLKIQNLKSRVNISGQASLALQT